MNRKLPSSSSSPSLCNYFLLHCISTTILLLLLATTIPTTNAAAAGDSKPETVIQERLDDAPQVLLIQTTNPGISTSILQDACGNQDTYYTTSAIVLGVNRTVDPDSTFIGSATGKVVNTCDDLQFVTIEKEWTNTENCEETADPGRVEEGWCGYIYLLEGSEGVDGPFALGTGGPRSYVTVDGKVCEEAKMKYCPDGASVEKENGGGDGGVTEDSAGSSVGRRVSSPDILSFVAALFASSALWTAYQY